MAIATLSIDIVAKLAGLRPLDGEDYGERLAA